MVDSMTVGTWFTQYLGSFAIRPLPLGARQALCNMLITNNLTRAQGYEIEKGIMRAWEKDERGFVKRKGR
jgi:hypothetical protein